MKIIDSNLLLYAVNKDLPPHAAARAWLEKTLSGTEPVGWTWIALLGFLRISTRASVFRRPLSLKSAFHYIEEWLARPCSTLVGPSDRHAEVLKNLLAPLGTGGNLTSDAHLAAIALEHGAEVCSRDNDFARFKGVRWTNPLA